MILDRIAYAKKYMGISQSLDLALKTMMELDAAQLRGDSSVKLDGDRVYYKVMNLVYTDRSVKPEYHRKYIDIHMPLTETEEMALCAAPEQPDASYDSGNDFGLINAETLNRVRIPTGWFCVCFPNDAHAPGLTTGADKPSRKVVFKVIDA